MIAVTQTTALDISAAPLGASAALPASVLATAAKENEFWQVMASADAAVLNADAPSLAKATTAARDTADKPDQLEPNANETIPDNAVLPAFAQLLMTPHVPAAEEPIPSISVVAAPLSAQPLPNALQATSIEGRAPDPIAPSLDQAKPAADQPPTIVSDSAEPGVLPDACPSTSANPANHEPSQRTEIARPVLAQATASPGSRTLRASTLLDDPNTRAPVAPDLPGSNIVPMKGNGIDLTNASVAGTVSKPDASQAPPTKATSESQSMPTRTTPDAHAPSQLSNRGPKPDTPPSTAENAWRQKWIGTDQLAAAKDVGGSEGAAALTKGLPVSLTNADAPQSGSGKLAVAAIPQAPKAVEPVLPPIAAKTTAIMPDAIIPRQVTEALIVPINDAKPLESALPDKLGLAAPEFGAPTPAPLAADGLITPPKGVVASSIPSTLTPSIIEMAKSGNDGPLELALSPEELGRVTISIRQEGDFVRVTLSAERPETLDLLRRHAGDLVADLRQSGFSGASLSFGPGDQDQSAKFAESPEDTKDQSQPPASETRPPAPSRSSKGSGMDLRF
jgi:flagellar hook-length control protein FliK